LQFQENKEKELEKQREEMFNLYRPMVPRGKEYRIKTSDQEELVKPVEDAVRPTRAVKLGVEPVKPLGPETLHVSSLSTPMACDNELTSAHELKDDETY
jgi:hypothetical protein